MAQLDKIRLSGTTYDIIDSTAVHSLDGYYTTGETNAAITAATNALAESIAEQGYQTSGDVQNAISGKADTTAVTEAISAAVSGKVDTSTYTAYTAATDTALAGKADLSDIPSVSGYADSVQYNTSSKYVEFYHGGTGGTKVYEFDASPFLIDGMVESVVITSVTSGGSEVTVLEITWNSAAGGQVTDIPLNEIFDASNYYTKSETSGKTEIANALAEKVNVADNNVEVCSTSTTTNMTTTYANGATSANASWISDPSIGGYQFYSLNVTVENQTGGTQAYSWTRNSHSDVDDDKVTITLDYGDYDAYLTITPKGDYRIVSLVGRTIDEEETMSSISFTVSRCTSYGQSAEVIGNTILPSLANKAETSALTAHTSDSTIHVTSSDKTTWNGKQDALVSGTNIKTVNNESLLGSGNITIQGGLQAEVSGTTLIFS